MNTPAEHPPNTDEAPYEGYDRCNACGCTTLDVTIIDQIDRHVCEVSIKCRMCWFEDYWYYGHLESVQEIGRLNCSTYD